MSQTGTKYFFGDLTYANLVNFEAGQLDCQDSDKRILYVKQYSKIPTISESPLAKRCKVVRRNYFKSKMALQGVYELRAGESGKGFLMREADLTQDSFVNPVVFYEND